MEKLFVADTAGDDEQTVSEDGARYACLAGERQRYAAASFLRRIAAAILRTPDCEGKIAAVQSGALLQPGR